MSAPDSVRTYLREPDVVHITRLHEFGDRAYGLFDGHVWVQPCGLVEIDIVGTETRECISQSSFYCRWPRVVANKRSLRVALRAELHLDEHGVSTPAAQRFTYEQLVMAHAIEITGVQQRDPGIQGRVDCRDTLRLIRRTVEIRHP